MTREALNLVCVVLLVHRLCVMLEMFVKDSIRGETDFVGEGGME